MVWLRRKQPSTDQPHQPFELRAVVGSYEEWTNWIVDNKHVFDKSIIDDIARRILRNGFEEPLSGRRVEPTEVVPTTGNWRETLAANGLNSRLRATLLALAEELHEGGCHDPKIFATEAVTPFALLLRGRYPKFLGAEYAKDEHTKNALFPIPHEDLTALTLPTDSFDFIVTNEVLEHVPDLDRALGECARVLKPGGWHIGTHPFLFMSPNGDVRSRLVDGEIVHLKEPEIHGNPVDPSGGSLVFETPGWDILQRAKVAGFKRAVMKLVASEPAGIVSEVGGIFVLCAQK